MMDDVEENERLNLENSDLRRTNRSLLAQLDEARAERDEAITDRRHLSAMLEMELKRGIRKERKLRRTIRALVVAARALNSERGYYAMLAGQNPISMAAVKIDVAERFQHVVEHQP